MRGAVRIKLSEDRRVFTPLALSSYRRKTIHKKRSAVERISIRLDVSFGFEQHFIRGQKKMRLRVGLALMVMLAMALGRAKEKRLDKLRSADTGCLSQPVNTIATFPADCRSGLS